MPAPIGPVLGETLDRLTPDPFAQAAILRLAEAAPHLLDTIVVSRLDAAVLADNHAAHLEGTATEAGR